LCPWARASIYLGAILGVACWIPFAVEVLADRCPAMQLLIVGPGVAVFGIVVAGLGLDEAQRRGGHLFGLAIFGMSAGVWFLALAGACLFFWPLWYFLFNC